MNTAATTIYHTLPSRNEAWGFWGTMGEQAEAAWPLTMHRLCETTHCRVEDVRNFLDNRFFGKIFSYPVHDYLVSGTNLADAISAAIATLNGKSSPDIFSLVNR